jgi:hypothetical protein
VPDQQNITQIDPIEWKNVAEMLILTSIKNETKELRDESIGLSPFFVHWTIYYREFQR